uniref:Uncharacterized protein n=1 Tax=Arundo donax TaxID=35708 RepID=A0A0A9DVT4_ARUDO
MLMLSLKFLNITKAFIVFFLFSASAGIFLVHIRVLEGIGFSFSSFFLWSKRQDRCRLN